MLCSCGGAGTRPIHAGLGLLVLVLVLVECSAPWHRAAMAARAVYQIQPLATYTYRPSGFSPIEECQPARWECGFVVEGSLVVELDHALQLARLRDVEILLLGNESVQHAPPDGALVTSDRLADLLRGLKLSQLPVAAPFDLYSDGNFFLRVLGRQIVLAGGYDYRPVDGDSVLIQWEANRIEIPGDLNDDGHVDALDAGTLFQNWGTVPPGDAVADLNHDLRVDAADASIVFAYWTADAELRGLPESKRSAGWLLLLMGSWLRRVGQRSA